MKSFTHLFTLFICTLILTIGTNAQHVLQIEKRNSPKTVKYYSGDLLIYKLDNDRQWRYDEILMIDVENDSIFLENTNLHINEIAYILPLSVKKTSQYLTWLFTSFGVPALTYSLIELAVGYPYNWIAFYAGAAALVVAGTSLYVLPWILQKKIGKRYRLRVLDLSFY